VRGCCSTTARSTAPRCIPSSSASTPTCCAGSARNTSGCAGTSGPSDAGTASPAVTQACLPTGSGTARPGDQGDKSPVSREAHAGICGSRGVQLPPATRPRSDCSVVSVSSCFRVAVKS
jgi:hypothetical protein